ncbi:MAG: S26 family signal peptidase [Bacillota bacterium]|nr:S26 family signal peptidase [Bacillota bacterium]
MVLLSLGPLSLRQYSAGRVIVCTDAAVAVPLAIVMLVVGNGFLRVLTAPIAVVGGVVLLLLVVAALLTLSLRYAVLERVMGLPWWRIAVALVIFGVVMSVPWGLYSGYATITYSTSDLAFFELMKPTLFSTYPGPGAKHTFTIREADVLFLGTPYMRANPQRGDVVLYVPESDLDLDLGLKHGAPRFPGLARLAMRGVMSVMTPGPRFAARIGRVVACPGENVALRDGVVYVDGAREAFSAVVGGESDNSRTSSSSGSDFSSGSGPSSGSNVTAVASAGSSSTSLDPTPLGEDEFFVIGDNRSADTGMVVKKGQILGRYPRLRLALNRASIPTVLRLGHDED